jgi:NHLM bacteriocin system ABC transporter peptidase/ATP-binding protein
MAIRIKRAKTTTILQMEAVECGAACLSMVLAHYGRHVPLERLREQCDVNRDGSKASNILKAARLNGMDAKGYRKEPLLLEGLRMPAVIHWNFNHFVVLEGIGKSRVYLNDPALGHRTVSFKEFEQSFTGVILTFEPGADFEKAGSAYNFFSVLREQTRGYAAAITLTFLIGLMLVIPGLIIPIFSRVFVDEILVGRYDDWFVPLLLGMGITALLRAGLEWMKVNYLLRTRTKMSLISSANFFWHVLRLPITFFNQRYSGEVGNRLGINNKVSRLITGRLASTLLDIFMLVFYASVMIQYDVMLTLAGTSISLLNIVAVRSIANYRSEEYRKLVQAQGKLMGVSMGGLQIIETLKSTGREDDFFVQWAGHLAKVMNASQQLSSLSILLNAIPAVLGALSSMVVLVLGAMKVMDGLMTLGMLVAFQSLMSSFAAPINSLIGLGSLLQETRGDIERLDDVMNAKTDAQTEPKVSVKEYDPMAMHSLTEKLNGYIEFRNVTFGYSRLSPPLIANFNLKIKPGQRVALIGGSGSGKSTVAKLLAGIYEPWSGEILFDGKPRHEWPRQIINNSLAMVDQEIFMFEGSIRDIITLWDESLPNGMVVEAAKDAEIHDMVASKKNGYDFAVSEGGKNFSGGQRQRLEIARALCANPSVLVLDEATSALDPLVELKVDDNIKKRKCSVLVVAHRLSTIRDSNEIIVMKHGQIVERGTHEELRDKRGEYWQLIKN